MTVGKSLNKSVAQSAVQNLRADLDEVSGKRYNDSSVDQESSFAMTIGKSLNKSVA